MYLRTVPVKKNMKELLLIACSLEYIFALSTENIRKLENLDVNEWTEHPPQASSSALPAGKELPLTTTADPYKEVGKYVPDSHEELPSLSSANSIYCPRNKSLYTEEDINVLIDFKVKTQLVFKSINNSYYKQAVAVRNKYLNDFNQFSHWYQGRPVHLKHVLEDVATLRRHIEPLVKRVALVIGQYPQLEEKYEEKLNRTNALLKKLNRYKIICEHNCESNNSVRISKSIRRSNFNTYYCSSLEDLYRNITSRLAEFVKTIVSTMLDKVTYDDQNFSKKIDVLKNKLKEVALNGFGKTMYDILTLQDEYHHFEQELGQVDPNSEVYTMKVTYLQIDAKLLELEQRLENYGTYCRSCNENSELPLYRKSNSPIIVRNKESKTYNILDYLLDLKYIEILNVSNNDYSNIFKELNSLLNDISIKDIYLEDLAPIQNEVIELIKEQQDSFNELKSIAAPSSVEKLIELSTKSKQLLININNEIDNLNRLRPK